MAHAIENKTRIYGIMPEPNKTIMLFSLVSPSNPCLENHPSFYCQTC